MGGGKKGGGGGKIGGRKWVRVEVGKEEGNRSGGGCKGPGAIGGIESCTSRRLTRKARA